MYASGTMLTQIEKEELWKLGMYEPIIANDIGLIKHSVNAIAGDWVRKDDMYSLAYEYCARAVAGWNGSATFCSMFRGCARNAAKHHMRMEARYKRAIDGVWYYGDDVDDGKPYYYKHLPLIRALSKLMVDSTT